MQMSAQSLLHTPFILAHTRPTAPPTLTSWGVCLLLCSWPAVRLPAPRIMHCSTRSPLSPLPNPPLPTHTSTPSISLKYPSTPSVDTHTHPSTTAHNPYLLGRVSPVVFLACSRASSDALPAMRWSSVNTRQHALQGRKGRGGSTSNT